MDKYIDTETASVMLILWLIGVLLVSVLAFIIPVRYSNKGFVDPDEPVGVLALQVLITKVFDQEPYLLDKYTWYFIPVSDPCGARLNEGWFHKPYDTRLYLLERFKVKVVEWKLPGSCNGYVFNEPTSEALAVKKAIDMVKPDLVVPLHNNDF